MDALGGSRQNKTKPTLKVIKGKAKVHRDNPYFGGKQAFWDYVNCDVVEYLSFAKKVSEKDCQKELSWMWRIMQRAIDDGFEPNNYANKYQKT